MKKSNIFANIPTEINEELFEDIISKDGIKIERIVSKGHTTTEFEWYNQNGDEWVIVLKGEAVLEFEDADEVRLKEGDYLNIPAHTKHKVSWTKPDEETVWLAIHY
ncbi:protein containing Cupin domain [Sulfurimonas gotlandica GD1]|jgi:cupin 2 domain-containing protein|uniref:Protein containing Cupin domain n=1 Tax=Sulfurimonas gotlandica (strain DSM 19862 / JCM 16533 / GD1) TaxID=929558 RepID=B6BI29_SULGG|nr:cupin domain-containing protein [Sulfurimonas gotlandica]EDZ63639.1 cupin family protein [Sulfurimonas gotlandica GD1]EHP30181.1 protein containing Cupin domain [Sulfurimonas gotlandica GD1]